MHYGKNEYDIVFFSVDYAIWETPDQCAVSIAFKNRPSPREAANCLYHGLDFGCETMSKP